MNRWWIRNHGLLIQRGLLERLKVAKFPSHILFLLSAMWDAWEMPE